MLSGDRVKEIFKKCGGLWDGHFLYSSGRHGRYYIQCARVSQYPEYNQLFCSELASRFEGIGVQVVVGAAVGGIIIAYEIANQLGARAVFTERVEGKMRLRRGLEVLPEEKVLLVEDVITTGGTVRELESVVDDAGAQVTGIAAFVNRNPERVEFHWKVEALLNEVMEDYDPRECPLCQQGVPVLRPGSKGLK